MIFVVLILVCAVVALSYGCYNLIKQNELLEEILVSIMSDNSKKDGKFWKEKTIKDYYLSPEEALELGVIDSIIEPKNRRG